MLSIALMVVDARVAALQPLRSHLSLLLTPVYYLADLPVRAWDTGYQLLESRLDLLAEKEGVGELRFPILHRQPSLQMDYQNI